MALRNSSESTSTSTTTTTTKVITESGELREFAGRATACQVLRKAGAGCFICDADGMGFDDYATAVGDGEELRPGGLYFVLPRSVLKRRMQPAEMAALAVRASAALGEGGVVAASGAGRSGEDVPGGRVAPAAVSAEQKRGRRSRRFTSGLSAIAE